MRQFRDAFIGAISGIALFLLIAWTTGNGALILEYAYFNEGGVFNETGIDSDFRVEGDTDTDLLFVDASTDRVGVSTNAPGQTLDVQGTLNASGAITGDATVTAGTGITATTGNIAASAGNVTANGDLTATTGDVSVGDDVLLADGAVVGITGNEIITFNAAGTINFSGASVDVDGALTSSTFVADTTVEATTTVTAGTTVSDSISNVRILEKVQDNAPTEPVDCTSGNEGTVIYVDDTNDNGFAKLCFCAYDDNPGTYEWQEVADPTTACF